MLWSLDSDSLEWRPLPAPLLPSPCGEPVWGWEWDLAAASRPLTRWSMALSVWLACTSAELSWATPSLVSLLP